MKLDEIAKELDLASLTPEAPATETPEISAGYASDLLSDVLANAPGGGVLVTTQVHMNVVAVAAHAGLTAVIFTSGRTPDSATSERAAEENVRLYSTLENTFDVVGRLYAMGLRGSQEQAA